MTTINETMATANNQLQWAFSKAVVSNQYEECVEKKFSGRVHPEFARKIIYKNNWNQISSNLKNGIKAIDYASSQNIGVEYVHATGKLTLTYYEAI